MKSGEKLYDMSHVQVPDAESQVQEESDSNPYAVPKAADVPERSVPAGAKVRVIPLLIFVFIGMALGGYFVPLELLPASMHTLQQFRGAAIGALLGVMLYAMGEFLLARRQP